MANPCPECGDQFGSEHALKIHYGTVHEGSLARHEVTCEQCGSTLERTTDQVNRSDRFFCDRKCQSAWRNSNEDNWGNEQHYAVCDWCGERFPKKPSNTGERAFCDRNCMGSWISENRSGENHPNYRGKDAKYIIQNASPYWRKMREAVLERDNHECWFCGLSEAAHDSIWGQSLHIHHSQPRNEFESDGDATHVGNLIALCNFCHSRVETALEN